MALEIGDIEASAGMAKAIYDQIRANIEPGLVDLSVTEAELEPMRLGWQKLAYAIAAGVVEHLLANLEVRDSQTEGDVSVSITGETAPADGHQHGAGTLTGTQNDVTFL